MTEAQTILDMLEAVTEDTPTETLDEIDYLVWTIANRKDPFYTGVPMYTRSRDALKAVRPDGVVIQVRYYPEGFQGDAVGSKGQSPRLPTEELAELHAIVQAIEWERTHEE